MSVSHPDDATRSVVDTAGVGAEPAEIVVGQTVGRYMVRKLLGAGGMGQVYVAHDIGLDREVALKLSVRDVRFIREARAIASLNHPNIVTVYDYGVHAGSVYLALEYIRGETLRERVRRAPLGIDETLRHARAIADALCHAHSKGVWHCDLKPANVMIGSHGEIKVVDFGIARTRIEGVGGASGTPGWMAPEQRGDALTDRVDSWALGLLVAHMLTGVRPPRSDEGEAQAVDPRSTLRIELERAQTPPSVTELITRSWETEPTLRPSVGQWRSALDEAIAGRSTTFIADGPFPGLASFGEQHARFYFGREREIDEFADRLRDCTHLPIVGASGSGKSSFLHAGVIPRLRTRERWHVIGFRPGPDPIAALARQLVAALNVDDEPTTELQLKARVRELRAALRDTPTRLGAELSVLANLRSSRVLLAVDQLEEVFTQCGSPDERVHFLEMLRLAAGDAEEPIRVVFTVRDDFIGKLAGFTTWFVVRELTVEDLRRTVTGPLLRHGYTFDDETVTDDLLAEVAHGKAGDLPLLQFACRTLWDGRDVEKRQILRKTYVEMGGLAGALARHADRALAALSPEEHRTARQLLLQLVSETTRRSVSRERLVASTGPTANAVLDRMIGARLLVQRSHSDGLETTAVVEIAHESLLKNWTQLARWIDESREERHLLEELEDATSLWERRGKRPEEVWAYADLVAARHRATQLDLALPERILAFIAAGEERDRRRQRRRWMLYASLAGAVVVAAAIGSNWVGRYAEREALIRNNAGTLTLVFYPYDWRHGVLPVPISELPKLEWELYGVAKGDPHQFGDPVPRSQYSVLETTRDALWRVDKVSIPGGAAFMKIVNRGRDGETCAPSWIRLAAIPGFAGPTDAEPYVLEVPTCQASRHDMRRVPAGPFIYGGPGDPPSAFYDTPDDPDYTQPEAQKTLPEFLIDRTEVSNARFAPFGRMQQITGYAAPTYAGANEPLHAKDSDPTYPVSEMDAFQAEAFCRYHGKSLPSDLQWVKAARGGLTVNGKPNPAPARLYPWGTVFQPKCANLGADSKGVDHDGFPWMAPVEAFACGDSPYGVRNLAGNVEEWISRAGQTDRSNPLHAMRGGGADSPAERDIATTIFRNHRNPRNFNFQIGIRCVLEP